MFTFFLLLIILLLLLIIFYDIKNINNFNFIKKIKNKKLQWIIPLIPILIIMLLFNYVNSLVILIHLAIFFLISNLLIYLIKKIFKKDFSFNLSGALAIIFTFIYLGIGAYFAYHIYETKYEIITQKELGQDNFRIIQISDSHVGTTFDGNGFYNEIKKISQIPCDLFIITGDFVDDDTTKEDMIRSCKALSLIKAKYGIYFVFGNHDRGYFNKRSFNENDLVNELEKNNVIVLKDEIKEINDYITIIGRDDKQNNNRKTIDELTNNLDNKKYLISLNHQPNDYKNEQDKVDLVLSGHSHGGQLFPLGYIGLLSKANDEFYGMHVRGKTTFIVNSGISDWAIDFKTGAISEYVIIDIKKK